MAKKEFKMNDAQKAKYAELFTVALDSMEGAQYKKPWISVNHGEPQNFKHKKPYRGINNFILTLLCSIKGWETPYFLTFDQMTDMGLSLNLKMGKDGMPLFRDNGMPRYEDSFPVVKKLTSIYRNHERITFDDYDALTDEEKEECRWHSALRVYPEFNLEQTNFKEKYPEKWDELTRIPEHEYADNEYDAVLEKMIMQGEWRCPIKFGGSECFYSPSQDEVHLPLRSSFLGDKQFYATALHEMAHSTAPECKREQKSTFGTEKYAMEEFIAELSSACVCSMLGIGKLLDENHIAYVQNWRQALRTEKDFIPQCIDHVQKATNYILRRYEEIDKQMRGPLALPLAA